MTLADFISLRADMIAMGIPTKSVRLNPGDIEDLQREVGVAECYVMTLLGTAVFADAEVGRGAVGLKS